MSYTTHVTGEFTITPPLSWREIKDSPFISPRWDASDLVLRVDETAVDTEDGQLVRKTASTLVMREISEYNCRNLMAQVQKAIDDFPGHTWTGRLDCEGEESADLWRVVIRDGKAVRVEPRIVWPDDEADEVQRLQDRVASLEEDSAILGALQAYGVDNWEGYSDALGSLN